MKLRYAMVLAGGLAFAAVGRAASDDSDSSGTAKMDKGSTPTDAASTPKQDLKQDEKATGDTPAAAATDSGTGSNSADMSKGTTATDAASTPRQDLKQDEKNTGDTGSSSTSSMKHHRKWKTHAKRNASAAGTGSSADMKQGSSPTDAASTPKEDLKQDAKTTRSTDAGGTGSSMAHDTMTQPSESEDSRQAPDASPDTKTDDSSTRP